MKRDWSIEGHRTAAEADRELREDVLAGLTGPVKWLPPKWFYDAEGGRLFELITRLPEYYPTRAEREILSDHAFDIADVTGARSVVELGSGTAEKTALLIEALRAEVYVPVDVSRHALEAAAAALSGLGVTVRGLVADFLYCPPLPPSPAPRLLVFLGGTIGNLLPHQRARFLSGLCGALEPGDALLLGADLVKDPAVLKAAYDDSAGVTAAFNRNVLSVLNRRLGADFDLAAFTHVVRWDEDREWIEMRLRAGRDLSVKISDLGLEVRFARGEDLLTEVSAKFRPGRLTAELERAGFRPRRIWTDAAERYGLWLAAV